MKYRDENGVFQDLYLPPTGDTLPIGSEVDYDGTEVPYGWEQISDEAKVLWTNSNPTSSFASQTVTLSSDDYDVYEVVYVSESTGTLNKLLKTVKSLKGYDTILEITNPLGSTTPIRARNVTYASNTSLTFSDGYAGNVYPLSVDNNKCIPLYIIGHKTGLFD